MVNRENRVPCFQRAPVTPRVRVCVCVCFKFYRMSNILSAVLDDASLPIVYECIIVDAGYQLNHETERL